VTRGRQTAPEEAATDRAAAIDPAAANERAAGVDRAPEEMPRVRFTRRSLIAFALFIVSALAFLYFALPKLVGLQDTWNRLRQGNVWWLAVAAVLEVLSFWGYVVLFRAVFGESARADSLKRSPAGELLEPVRTRHRIGWRESYQITMAGLAATRLFAAAGAGGIALTAWALRRAGMDARVAACRLIAFMVILYAIYMGALVIDGVGLYLGLIPGQAPFAITIGPAIFGAVVIVLFYAVSQLGSEFDRLVARLNQSSHRVRRLAGRMAAVPAATATGVRTALAMMRSGDARLLGAPAWWGFDIAVLWACFHAFGASPPKGVIVMSYFVGMLGNTLPLPGGIGGVDGGMIGAFTAFGIDVEVSIISVLAYRAFAFWLPTLPGAVAYFQLRRTVNRWRTEPSFEGMGGGSSAAVNGASASYTL
jgi:putative heme transporter